MSIRCEDIRDQNIKLSEIAPNFGRILPWKILGVRPAKNLYPNYHACPAARHVWGHVTSSVTWPLDLLWEVSC